LGKETNVDHRLPQDAAKWHLRVSIDREDMMRLFALAAAASAAILEPIGYDREGSALAYLTNAGVEATAADVVRWIMAKQKLTTSIAQRFMASRHVELSRALGELDLVAGVSTYGDGYCPRLSRGPGM